MNDGTFHQGKDIKGRGDFGKTHPFSLKPWEGMDKPSESPWNGLKKSKIWNQRTKIKELAEGEQPTTKPNQTNKNKKQIAKLGRSGSERKEENLVCHLKKLREHGVFSMRQWSVGMSGKDLAVRFWAVCLVKAFQEPYGAQARLKGFTELDQKWAP